MPYERIAEEFIAAVERGAFPVTATAVAVSVDRLWLERRLWEVRQVGWLPKGPSPLPGEDPSAWLARARALLAERRAERASLQEQLERKRGLTRERVRLRQREWDRRKAMSERALKPSPRALDRFGLL